MSDEMESVPYVLKPEKLYKKRLTTVFNYKQTGKKPYRNPFFNFLRCFREDHSGNILLISKTAAKIWNSMSESEKEPFRIEARKAPYVYRSRKRKRHCMNLPEIMDAPRRSHSSESSESTSSTATTYQRDRRNRAGSDTRTYKSSVTNTTRNSHSSERTSKPKASHRLRSNESKTVSRRRTNCRRRNTRTILKKRPCKRKGNGMRSRRYIRNTEGSPKILLMPRQSTFFLLSGKKETFFRRVFNHFFGS